MPFCFASSEPILFLDKIIISFSRAFIGSAYCRHAGERRATVTHGTPVLTAVFWFEQADAVLLTWQYLPLRYQPKPADWCWGRFRPHRARGVQLRLFMRCVALLTKPSNCGFSKFLICKKRNLVGVRGFEPLASASRTQRSTRLSHTPLSFITAEGIGGFKRLYQSLFLFLLGLFDLRFADFFRRCIRRR